MTTITAAETRIRPASALLEGRLAADLGAPSTATAEMDLLAVEQQRLTATMSDLIARMDDPRASASELDRLTDRIAALLVRAEDVRTSRARVAARRSGDGRRWREYLDPA